MTANLEADNPFCEVHAYPETGKYAILNNSEQTQSTMVYNGVGEAQEVRLEGSQILWKEI